MNIDNFDWGWMNDGSDLGIFHKSGIYREIFNDMIYERCFEVEQNDIVVDIGASVGPFTYSILNKKPKHVFCIEPSEREFPTLVKNTIGYPVTQILKGISDKNTFTSNQYLFGGGEFMEGITFKKLCELYNISKIDFLKTDCEGGEYYIFTDDNMEFILKNILKIVGEWHLSTHELKNKFRFFRDIILKKFKSYKVFSIDGVDITWDVWNEHFVEYYSEVIFYIDNR